MINEEQEYLKYFLKNIKERLSLYSYRLITEDCIRYDFFHSICRAILPSQIILEYPHTKYTGKKIDCVISNNNFKKGIEFKYFSEIPSGQNDRTQQMASLIADCYRLLNEPIISERQIIVLSMKTMNKYISNRSNGFNDLYGRNEIIEIRNLNEKGKHFIDTIKKKTDVDLVYKDIRFSRLLHESILDIDNFEYKLSAFDIEEC